MRHGGYVLVGGREGSDEVHLKDRKHFLDYIINTVRSTGGRYGANQPITPQGAARALDAMDWMLGARSRQTRSRRASVEWPPLADWPTTSEWPMRAMVVSRSSVSHVSMALRVLHEWLPQAVETPAEWAMLDDHMPQSTMFTSGGAIAALPEHVELLRHLDRIMRPILAVTQVQKLQWGVHLFVDDDENVTVLDPTHAIDWSSRLTTWTTRDTPTADAVRALWATTSTAEPEAFVFGAAHGGIATIESLTAWLDSEGLQRPRRRRYDTYFRRAWHQETTTRKAQEEEA